LSSVSFFNSLIPLDCLGLAVDISFHWPPGDGNSQLHRAQTQSETQANWTQPNWTELSVEQRSNLVIPVAVVVILMVFFVVVVGTFNLCLVNASGTNNNLLWRRFCRILESVYLRSSTTIFVELVVVIVGRGSFIIGLFMVDAPNAKGEIQKIYKFQQQRYKKILLKGDTRRISTGYETSMGVSYRETLILVLWVRHVHLMVIICERPQQRYSPHHTTHYL